MELMEKLIKTQTTEHVIERASWTHFYVVEDKESIVGYQYKNGIKEPDDEHLIRMEKFR